MSFLTREEIEEITRNFVETRIIPAMQERSVDGVHCHVVVLDPAISYHKGITLGEAIAYEQTVKLDEEDFKYPFDRIARSKAAISFQHGLPSRVVVQTMPHLLRLGDTIYGGSVVLHGLIVAISGFDEWDDESFSGQLAYELWRKSMAKLNALRKANHDFVTY